MNSSRWWLVWTVWALLEWFAGVVPARATEMAAGDNVVIRPDRDVEDDLVAVGGGIQVQAKVKGDVTAAGGNVNVSGDVQGDVTAAAGNVVITNPIGDDLRAAGGNVIVGSSVADNAQLAGGTVVIQPGGSVGRDADLAGGEVLVQGRVGRNLKLAAGNAEISSEVGGAVTAYTQRLRVMPRAVIKGDLVVYGPNPPEISPEAKIEGKKVYHKTEQRREGGLLSWIGGWVVRFLCLLVLGSVVIALSRVWTDRIAETMTSQAGASALTGCLSMIVVPIGGVLLLITVIGIPLALVVWALYGAALLLSGVFVAYRIGAWMLSRFSRAEASPYAWLAVGALVVAFLTALPWIGWLLQLAVLVMGVGALLVEQWGSLRRLQAEGLA